METDSILQKCGEILINIQLTNKKTKQYTFNCVFCNENWNQLKKFTKHMEENHLQEFCEISSQKSLKFEEQKYEQSDNISNVREDLLEQIELVQTPLNDEYSIEDNVLNEQLEEILQNHYEHDDEYLLINENMDYEEFTDYNVDNEDCTEFQPEGFIEETRSIRTRQSKTIKGQPMTDNCPIKSTKINNSDPELYSQSEQELINVLFEAFSKQTYLWKEHENELINDESILENGFQIIANEVNEKLSSNLNKEVAKNLINEVRMEYSHELEKQRKGEPHQLSWYSENIEFFNENMEAAVKIVKSTTKNTPISKKSKSEPKIYSESEKQLIMSLFEAYAKQSYLWKEHKRKRVSDKSILEKAFETIANEVNGKLSTTLTGDLAKNLINEIRIEYSYEVEKQQNGKPHHMPWYSEHLDFLKKNIDSAIKSRERMRRERIKQNLTKLDDAYLLTIIELYRKNEPLWQINNINFGISEKREETFNHMIEDLKNNYNIDMTTDLLYVYIKYIHRLYTKDREQQLKCELAGSEFTPSCEYYQEMYFLNESQGPFKCEICHEIIKGFDRYYQHVAHHSNTIPFKCSLCEMSFKKFEYYTSHVKRHLGIIKFLCNVCGKGYPNKSELDWHITSHTGERPHLCQHCGASYRALNDYKNHIRRHEKRFRYECKICKRGFIHQHTLKDHIKSHLNIRENICNICGKAFTSVKYLKYHKLIHDTTKRYKCEICGKGFSQTAGLRQHRKQHERNTTAKGNMKKRQI